MSEDASPVGGPGWDRGRGPSLVSALWRYRWAVLVVAFLFGVAGYVNQAAQPPVFEAVSQIKLLSPYEQTLFRQERGVAYVEIDRYLNSQADLVKSQDVLVRASKILHGRIRPGEIRQHVNAQSSTTLLAVTIRGRFGNPQQAADVVNAVTQAYQEAAAARVKATVDASVGQLKTLERDLRRRLLTLPDADSDPTVEFERNNLSDELASLETKAGQIKADAAVYGAGIDRIDRAHPPEVPISDSPRRKAVIFGLLGFIAALVGAFWRSERIQVIASRDDAAGAVNAPLLGVLPRHPRDTPTAAAPVVTAPESPAAREHQFIASNLTLIAHESESHVLLMTSPEAGDAKSVAALNIALSAAQDQRTVILVDLHASGVLTSLLGAEDDYGVSDLLAHSVANDDFVLSDCVAEVEYLPPVYAHGGWRREGREGRRVQRLDSVGGFFRFIPAGRHAGYGRGPAASPQVAKLLAQLHQEADLIVVDGPPLLESPEAVKLAAIVDGLVLVVRRGTKLDRLRKARVQLDMARAPVLGYVFDQSRSPMRRRLPWYKSRRMK